jgi:hypothetical protein
MLPLAAPVLDSETGISKPDARGAFALLVLLDADWSSMPDAMSVSTLEKPGRCCGFAIVVKCKSQSRIERSALCYI